MRVEGRGERVEVEIEDFGRKSERGGSVREERGQGMREREEGRDGLEKRGKRTLG